jgi:hypothetical protein
MYIDNVIAKGQLVPLLFSQDAAADAQSAVAMNILEVAATVLAVQEYVLPFDFDIIGISVVSDLARTAGTLTVDATIDGTATGLQAKLDATNTFRHYQRQARESDRGKAGQRIGVKLTTASWTPITADIVVVVWAIVGLEGI